MDGNITDYDDKLRRSRQDVQNALERDASWKELIPLIETWFQDLKSWERADDFGKAFRDDRMTIRQIDIVGGRGGTWNVPSGAKITLARDEASIHERMDPKKFFDPARGNLASQKNLLGLHDLSAHLLTHTRPITQQLKYYSKAYMFFMPLPLMADLRLFSTLNQKAKREVEGAVTMRTIRSKLTRVKLAQASDMGATFKDINPAGQVPKFRYGLEGTILGEELRGLAVKVARAATPQELEARQTNSLKYQDILLNPVVKVNEIIVAFRSHASPLFPFFALRDGKAAPFPVLDPHTYKETNFIITDTGEYRHK
jgi:hypothetical protein